MCTDGGKQFQLYHTNTGTHTFCTERVITDQCQAQVSHGLRLGGTGPSFQLIKM